MATMVLSRTVSEINGDFCRKSQNFPTPVHFAPQLKGFPLELDTGAGGQKTRMTGLLLLLILLLSLQLFFINPLPKQVVANHHVQLLFSCRF